MFAAVVFDLYGTLTDPSAEAQRIDRDIELARLLGCPPDQWIAAMRESFKARATGRWGDARGTLHTLCERIGIDVAEELADRALALRLRHHFELTRPRPEAVEVLQTIRSLGLPIAVVSDCSPEITVTWPRTPLAALVDATVFSCVEGRCKPDPDMYLTASRLIGTPPGECLYIGDGSGRELTGARDVGMHPVLIEGDHGMHVDKEPNWIGPTITSLYDVLPFLDRRGTEPAS